MLLSIPNSLVFSSSLDLKIKINKTIILTVVLYGNETWSRTSREDCRQRFFENRILKQLFRAKTDENGKWRRLHNEELHSLYHLPNIVRMSLHLTEKEMFVGYSKHLRTSIYLCYDSRESKPLLSESDVEKLKRLK